jgi:hypothetical protein
LAATERLRSTRQRAGLRVSYASTTGITASYASTTNLFAGSATVGSLSVGTLSGIGLLQNGVLSAIATSSLGLLTSNVAEGSNLYFTNARVQTFLDTVDKGYFFSTTSADYWKGVNNFFSTTSADYFIAASTTILKASSLSGGCRDRLQPGDRRHNEHYRIRIPRQCDNHQHCV